MKNIELSNGRNLWIDPRGLVTVSSYTNALGKRRKPSEHTSGSFRIIGETFFVHRLVAQAYLPAFRDKCKVIFIDGNTSNCSAANLRIGSPKSPKISRAALLKYEALKYSGVSYYPRNRLRPYHAMSFDKILSCHKTAISAAIAADTEAVKHGVGDWLLNFPELQ